MLGYLCSVGIAVGGIMAGIHLSAAQQSQAQLLLEEAKEDLTLPLEIKENLFIAQVNQGLLPSSVRDPEIWQERAQRFQTAIANAGQAWADLKETYNASNASATASDEKLKALESLFKKYDPLIESYHRRVNGLTTEITLEKISVEEREVLQLALLELNSDALQKSLDGFNAELEELLGVVSEELLEAEAALAQAHQFRDWVTLGSLTAAILLSIGLSFLISRTITRPLKQSAEIAQRVANEDNFDLQVPLTSKDEVGQLTQTLNLLIQRVQVLLQEKEASKNLLVHNEKMSSLGQLVAGVAHEINNPVNFIHGNLSHARNYTQDLFNVIQLYQQETPHPSEKLQTTLEDVELEFLQQDLEKILDSMKLGSDRIRDIVLSLRNFSRLDEAEIKSVYLHDGIESTLMILQHRLKARLNRPEIKLSRYYDSTVPAVECYASQLNQVFMNLITNAIDALEADSSNDSPTITIRTGMKKLGQVLVQISDNGPGMPAKIQNQIFDPFFTTKPVGKGTGIGLAISHQIVVEKHGGQMTCKSSLAQGTTFSITLPVKQPKAPS